MSIEPEPKKKQKNASRNVVGVITFLLFFITPITSELYETFRGADSNKIRETPKYLKICHRSDKKINKCIKSSLEKFLENVNSDSGKLSLPNIDPIQVPSLEFHQGSGNVSLNIVFKDFRILGFKNFKIISVKSNLNDNKFEISMESPYMDMMAQFSAEGGVYTFPIAGKGDFYLNLTEVSAVLIVRLATVGNIPGFRYFSVENCLVDLLPGDISAYFGEHIDGSRAIGAAFNTFFNDNAQEIFTLIKPKVSKILADIFGAIADEVLGKHPEDVLLPN